MLGRDFEDEVWSRFVFELVIWPNRLLWKDELNPRVRCAFGNVFDGMTLIRTLDSQFSWIFDIFEKVAMETFTIRIAQVLWRYARRKDDIFKAFLSERLPLASLHRAKPGATFAVLYQAIRNHAASPGVANGLLEQVVFVMSSQNQDRGPRLTYTHSLASMGDVGIRDHLMNATCLEIPSWTADLLQVLNSGPFYHDQQTYLSPMFHIFSLKYFLIQGSALGCPCPAPIAHQSGGLRSGWFSYRW